jgi:hypothetical protein
MERLEKAKISGCAEFCDERIAKWCNEKCFLKLFGAAEDSVRLDGQDHFFEDVDVPAIIQAKPEGVGRFVNYAAMKRDEGFFVANLQKHLVAQPKGIGLHESSILSAGRLGTAVALIMRDYYARTERVQCGEYSILKGCGILPRVARSAMREKINREKTLKAELILHSRV